MQPGSAPVSSFPKLTIPPPAASAAAGAYGPPAPFPLPAINSADNATVKERDLHEMFCRDIREALQDIVRPTAFPQSVLDEYACLLRVQRQATERLHIEEARARYDSDRSPSDKHAVLRTKTFLRMLSEKISGYANTLNNYRDSRHLTDKELAVYEQLFSDYLALMS